MSNNYAFSPNMVERFWAKVDKGSGCWLWTGTIHSGYGRLSHTVEGRTRYFLAHRYSLELAGHTLRARDEVDHRCRNRACVRPDHLRIATRKQNAENVAGARRNSKSGIRGVFWDDRDQRWIAQVRHHGRYHRKSLKTAAEASEWARLKRIELFTHNDADRVA